MKLLTYGHYVEGCYYIPALYELTISNPTEEDKRYSRVKATAEVVVFLTLITYDLSNEWDGLEDTYPGLELDPLLLPHEDSNSLAREVLKHLEKSLKDSTFSLLMCRAEDEKEVNYIENRFKKACCGCKIINWSGPSFNKYLIFINWGH